MTWGMPATPARPTVRGRPRVGDILGRAWSTYAANFLPLLLLSAVPSLIWFVVGLVGRGEFWFAVLGPVLSIAVAIPLTAAFVLGTARALAGRPPDYEAGLRLGITRFWPLLGVLVASSLATILGFVLLVVPGVIVGVMLSASVPVAVREGLGVVESLRRSAELTKGHRLTLLGAFAVPIAALVIGITASAFIFMAFGLVHVLDLASLVWGFLVYPYLYVAMVVAYEDLAGLDRGAP
jgi:hypothetical protein